MGQRLWNAGSHAAEGRQHFYNSLPDRQTREALETILADKKVPIPREVSDHLLVTKLPLTPLIRKYLARLTAKVNMGQGGRRASVKKVRGRRLARLKFDHLKALGVPDDQARLQVSQEPEVNVSVATLRGKWGI